MSSARTASMTSGPIARFRRMIAVPMPVSRRNARFVSRARRKTDQLRCVVAEFDVIVRPSSSSVCELGTRRRSRRCRTDHHTNGTTNNPVRNDSPRQDSDDARDIPEEEREAGSSGDDRSDHDAEGRPSEDFGVVPDEVAERRGRHEGDRGPVLGSGSVRGDSIGWPWILPGHARDGTSSGARLREHPAYSTPCVSAR